MTYIKIIVLVALLHLGGWGQIATADNNKVYSVGIVPQFETRRLHRIWRPLLDKLEEETGFKLVIKGSSSIPEFEKQLIAGEFDFAYMNPYHLIWSNENQNYIPLVRDHSRKLHGVLVVRKDSDLNEINKLDGKTLVFPAPNALGASLMMRAELKTLHNISFTPRYVKNHDSVYFNVILKQAAAGGGVQKTLNKQKPEIKDKLRVLYRTKKVSPHPFAAHGRVLKSDVEKVKAAFINMSNTEEGNKLLRKIPINKIGQATISDYSDLSNMGLDKFREN